MPSPWTCYLICSLDTGHTYIGASNDPERRLGNHNAGVGAKRTRGQTWVPVLQISGFDSMQECLSFEAGWKRISKRRNKARLASIDSLIDVTYTQDSRHNRIVDLLYFLYHSTCLENHYVFDPLRKKPLFFSPLTIHVFQERAILHIQWPSNVHVQMMS